LYNVARTQQTLEEIRKVYWSDRLSLIQLQKIMASYSEPSWFSISNLLFGATDFNNYEEFTQMLIKQFGDLHQTFTGLLSKIFSKRVQAELHINAQIVQILREIESTLEAILILLSNALDSESMFSILLEAFWGSSFFSKKELTCLSSICRKIANRIRNLQCFILIRSGHLEIQSDDHFMKKHASRLVASVSSLSKMQENAPIFLLAAVCGSVFGSTEGEISKASNLAFVAIQELGVFNYLCGILQNHNFTPGTKSNSQNVSDFDFLTLPESLSVVSLCSHLAVFDLLTLLARQVAVDSLGEHRSAFTRVLAKTLSVVVHCNWNMSATETKFSRIGQGITSVIADLAQWFPLDLDLLQICIALLNTGDYNRTSIGASDDTSIPDIVVQFISRVPYFAERFSDPSVLRNLACIYDNRDDEENGEFTVSLLRQHRCYPPDAMQHKEQFLKDKSCNHLAVNMPAGTRGELRQDGSVVVWQRDYSIWPILNSIVVSAERTLVNGLDDPSQVSFTITRLVSCLDFVDACLLAKVEPARCLALTELNWSLVTRIFTESLSGERETPVSQILITLSADLLLPCLLRLTAHSAAFADSSNGIVGRLSGDVFRCLRNDRILCPSAVLQENKKHHFTLSDSCLLRFASQNETTAIGSWCNVPPSTAFSLVSSYLDLALQFLSAEKVAFFADAESYFSESEEEGAFKAAGEGHSPLLACLIFCYQLLVEAGGSPSRRFNIIPRLAAGAPCSKTGVLDLINKAILFFVELLTSFSVDNICDEGTNATEISLPSFDLPILHYRDLRSYAHWLLSNSEPFLNCLLSLTKVSVDALQIPLQSMDFDFLRFSTRADEDQIGGVSALGQHRVQSTWLAITLFHSLFPSLTTSSSDGHFTTLLKTLSTNDTISSAYFLHLLNFLDPSCTAGLTRATVSLLKKLNGFSDRLITPHLHDMQPRLLRFLIDRLRSTFSDQVTRIALIDWLAEIVMQDVLSGVACAPFNGPGFSLLRMLSSLTSSTSVANSSANDLNVDGLQGILSEALKGAKANESDPLSMNLYWSLLKLTAAIWMQPNNLFRHQIRETADFWKLLSDPFSSHMSAMKKSKILPSVVDLEIAGNYATIIAIELFEFLKSTQNPDDVFTELIKKFSGEVLVPWLQIAFQLPDGSESPSSNCSKLPTMDALEWAVIRWKSIFCTLLKWNTSMTDEKMYLISRSQIVDLVDACLDKATLWISLFPSRAVVSIIDQLSVFLAAAAGYLASSSETSTLPFFEWVHRCVALLEHRAIASPSTQQQTSTTIKVFSHYHAELFAFITLLLPKVSHQDMPAGLFERLLNLCLEVFQDVSLAPSISNIDSEAFIQAMNVIQLIWKNFDAVKLANSLIDAGIVNNLIAILAQHSTTFHGAEFCQAIIRLLTRFLLPVNQTKSLYPDLSVVSGAKEEISVQSIASYSPLPRMLLSYASDLVQALRLPPTKQMMQWLAQADEYNSNSISQDELYPNTSWSEFILSQLRFLSLLIAREGGSGESTPVANLLSSFILANHEQLCALLTPAPAKGLLIASAVLDLYWTAMHSSNAATKLATPTCPDGVSVCLPSDIWSVVYSSSVQLARTCATLLLRPEIVDIPKLSSPPSVSTLTLSPETTKASTRLSISLKLLPIVRLLNSCLRVIIVQTPILGDLSLASASEIAALTPSATLNFATPSTEPSSALTFGLLFSVARTSSQLLVNINNSKTVTEEQLGRRRSEILSILVEVNELAFSLIFSQAVIWLMNPRIDTSEKHTLSRGLAVEFQSYNFLGRSSRRRRKSIGSHTPVRGVSSSPCRRSFVDPSDTTGEFPLQELFVFIECAERFSELVK
uniref:Nucleoporin NUP188-like protein n=2 Tax=Hymenolepis diminuta TaxID=6216 RepID=A0A0R3SDM4_HYMDI